MLAYNVETYIKQMKKILANRENILLFTFSFSI
jgi:hypothetical protein